MTENDLRLVMEAIDAEEELDGSMPDEMRVAMGGDTDLIEKALQTAVQLTKEGIKSRIRDQFKD
jgi:hypothetical protein